MPTTSPGSYLKPNVSLSKGGEKMKKRGMFVGNQPYPQLGGFSSPSKLQKAELMSLERGGPSSAGSKPL